jgi:UDP-N-acetylglucosamine 4,6-dehydratase/5-epimerase
MLSKKSILITGGTGSFGKKFTKMILERYPDIERIIIFSRDEFKQLKMDQMTEFKDNSKLRFFIGDVRDKERLYRAFTDVDIVIHAAALKQVPSCEFNPFEAIKTNILGAQNIINAAIDKNVEKVIALSTDKACAPVNLYGATKLCSDKLFIAGNVYSGKAKTRFSVVRYGNVAGSRGSVIPFFLSLAEKGEIGFPITDTLMTRFWLQLDDAVEMVLMAIEKMYGGELFVKKIPSMKITELAKAICPNVKLKTIGIRPGEKIHEVMITQEDATNTYDFDDHYIIKSPIISQTNPNFTGKKVADTFEYNSGSNSWWLTQQEMKKLIYNE